MKKPIEYDLIKEKLKDLELKEYNVKLELDNNDHHGFNRKKYNALENIWWYKYEIKPSYKGYDFINLMFFKITEKEQQEAAKRVSDGDSKNHLHLSNRTCCITQCFDPHVDGKTGNIHPGTDFVTKQGYKMIQQLVLCKKGETGEGGPNTIDHPDIINELKNNKEYIYDYGENTKVHKACYYPLIHNSEELKQDWRYKFLENVAKKIDSNISNFK